MGFDFQAMIDVNFATFGIAAEYFPLAGPPQAVVTSSAVTVIPVQPESQGILQSQTFRLSAERQETARLIDVRKSEVALPKRVDRFVIGDIPYEVRGEPELDEEKLVWRCELVEIKK